MSSNKLRLGLIGGGANSFIGIAHRIAAHSGEQFSLVGGVFGSDHRQSKEFARQLDLDESRTYADVESFIERELLLPESQRIEVVSVLTPNFLHYPVAKKLIEAGFNIICEKPMTFTLEQAENLAALVAEKSLIFCVAHTYTGYPMVRQMREMIAAGAIGKLQKIDGQYYQGWINEFVHDAEKRSEVWRLNPEKSGQSCCFGDIGVHLFNLIEFTTGAEVASVLADVDTMYIDNPLDVDGTALIRTGEGVRGIIRASQIATGEENNISLAIYGDKGALKWEQEKPTVLHFLQEGKPAQIFKPGNDYNSAFAQESNKLAPGHPEGMFDALSNIYSGVAKAVRKQAFHQGAFPGVADGVRGMRFIEAVLSSDRQGQVWVWV